MQPGLQDSQHPFLWVWLAHPISTCNLALAFQFQARLSTGAGTALCGTKMPFLWMCESRTHLLFCCVGTADTAQLLPACSWDRT